MVGLGLVTIPYAYAQAGLILGLFITTFQWITSSYTCWMCLYSSGYDIDYTDTVNKYFGKKGWIAGMVIFIINLIVPIIIYIQLLAQTLAPNLLLLVNLGRKKGDEIKYTTNIVFDQFNYSWTCIVVFVGVFLVTMRKDLAIFIKLNFLGAWMIFVVIIFILGFGIYGFTNTKYHFINGQIPLQDWDKPERAIPLFNVEFATIMGMLGGGYYLHNISIPIARCASNQKTVNKDIMLGYFFCFLSYVICGTLGLFGFYGTYFKDFYWNNQNGKVDNPQYVAQDIFNMLDDTNGIAIFVRACVFFHLFTIMALIFANERALIFILMYGKPEIESKKITYLVNFLLLIPGTILGIFYPKIAALAGYLASISGFLCIYALPSIVYMR